MYSAYWRRSPHYDSPACFSCSIVSFEGRGFFSCVSVFFNFDLSNFSISAISGLSDMVAGRSRASCANEESLICSEAAAGRSDVQVILHRRLLSATSVPRHCAARLHPQGQWYFRYQMVSFFNCGPNRGLSCARIAISQKR